MPQTAQLVSVEEYLRSSYEDGDREYVDGVIVERNLGERPHSFAQKRALGFFLDLERQGLASAFPEQRVQVAETRFRVPDVCVYLADPLVDIFHTPPFLVIEIVSREDRAGDLEEKVEDYLAFGVPFIWVVNPWRKKASISTQVGSYPVRDGILRTENPRFELPLHLLFD